MKMIKIKINKRNLSDVTEMFAKGWRASVFRGEDFRDDFVIVSKERIKFEIRVDSESHNVIINRFVDGRKMDAKKFYDTGVGINGNICILEADALEQTYCFFRTNELQRLIDVYSLKKVLFAKQSGDKFNFTYQSSDNPDVRTDGEIIRGIENGKMVIEVKDATYIYDFTGSVLIIPQVYDPEKLDSLMKEITGK